MYLLFDIGGTNMRVAVSRDQKSIGKPIIEPTPKKFTDAMAQLKRMIESVSENSSVKLAAGGVAGVFGGDKARLAHVAHLPNWEGKPIKKIVNNIINVPVLLENDAALAGLGEAVYGSGKIHNIVAYITIGTGIGGARIVNKKIDAAAFGFEPGHQILHPVGPKCPGCGQKGHAESYKSQILTWPLMSLLNNTAVYWSPKVIILGGGVILNHLPPISIIKRKFKQICTIFPQLPIIKKAALGDHGGLWGALALLNQPRKR